jgi:hypothetical protein
MPLHSDRHKWFYVPQMQLHEAVLFKQIDGRYDAASNPGCAKHTFHTSFHDPSVSKDTVPEGYLRHNVEVRVVCAFGPELTAAQKAHAAGKTAGEADARASAKL